MTSYGITLGEKRFQFNPKWNLTFNSCAGSFLTNYSIFFKATFLFLSLQNQSWRCSAAYVTPGCWPDSRGRWRGKVSRWNGGRWWIFYCPQRQTCASHHRTNVWRRCSGPALMENVQKLVLGYERRRLEMIQMSAGVCLQASLRRQWSSDFSWTATLHPSSVPTGCRGSPDPWAAA